LIICLILVMKVYQDLVRESLSNSMSGDEMEEKMIWKDRKKLSGGFRMIVGLT
jgi:hypothetical protein